MTTEEQFPLPPGSEVSLKCITGYTLTGDASVTCKAGTQFVFIRTPYCQLGGNWDSRLSKRVSQNLIPNGISNLGRRVRGIVKVNRNSITFLTMIKLLLKMGLIPGPAYLYLLNLISKLICISIITVESITERVSYHVREFYLNRN